MRPLGTGSPTRLVSMQDALQLVMVLPGRTSHFLRMQFAHVIQRFLSGERSLLKEVSAVTFGNREMSKAFEEAMFAEWATQRAKRKVCFLCFLWVPDRLILIFY